MRFNALATGLSISLTAVLGVTASGVAHANSRSPRPEPSSRACSPSVDIKSFSDALDKTTFQGKFVGNISALAVDRHGTIDALTDTSTLFALNSRTLQPRNVKTIADEKGQTLDAEALVVDRDGSRLITSEREPSIRRYSADGKIKESLPIPTDFKLVPEGRAAANHSLEGLTLMPGGHTLVASMERALTGDNTDLVRLQTWQRAGDGHHMALGPQYAYHVDTDDNGTVLGVSDIASTDDGRLLVLERGFTPSVGNTVRIFLADLGGASDVSHVTNLTGQQSVKAARKTLLADLVNCPALGATAKEPQPNPLLDNIEGITVTGQDRDGRLNLLLVSDDNQLEVQTTRFYSLTARLPHHTA